MTLEYDILYSSDYHPDLTEVNKRAQEGWGLIQIGQAKNIEFKDQWFYLLERKAVQPPPAVPAGK
jgi:hypothetical protein